MTDNTEGYLLATSSLSVALLGTLINKGVLSSQDVAEITDSAELYFASMPPTIMSPGAREFARGILQQVLDGYRPKPDARS